jgi:hypothetical protein
MPDANASYFALAVLVSSGFARYIVIFSVSAGTAAVFSSFLLSSSGSSFI